MILEMRTYLLKPGMTHNFVERFAEGLTARLDALSPLKVLARGYAVAFDARGHALVQASQVQPGERVRVRLHEGELSAQVEETKKGSGDG